MKFRLLPALIVCASVTVSLKIASLWGGFDAPVTASPAVAQEQAAPPDSAPAPPPEAAPAEDGKDAAMKTGDPAMAEKPGTEGAPGAAETMSRFDPLQVTDSELNVLQQLAHRRAELERREQTLDTRENLLRATEQRIEAKVAELKEMQETIGRLLKKHDKQEEAQLRSVVKIYERMKPKDAARIFEELDMRVLLDVVERMSEVRAAPIIANMTAEKAKSVTAALTQRRALPKPEKRQRN